MRSYISAVSEIIDDDTTDCNGKAQKNMGEARMDIEDSEMAYLGYHGSESYGLTWKVMGERERMRGVYCLASMDFEFLNRFFQMGNLTTVAPPNFPITKSPVLKPARGRFSQNTVPLATPTSSFDNPSQTREDGKEVFS